MKLEFGFSTAGYSNPVQAGQDPGRKNHTVDELITIGRQDIEIEALTRMQDLSKRYHLGIRVDQVQLKTVNPSLTNGLHG